MRLRSLFWVAAAALILPALGCGKGRSTDEILIGEYGSLTGGTATFGHSTKNGSTMAFDEINAAGGVLGKKVSSWSKTTSPSPRRPRRPSRSSSTRTTSSRCSGRSPPPAPSRRRRSARPTTIPMVSPSSTNPRVTQVGDYIFRVCFIDPFQGAGHGASSRRRP